MPRNRRLIGKVNTVKDKLEIFEGSEGPREDPYEFREYVVTPKVDKNNPITLHLGLGEQVLRGRKVIGSGSTSIKTFESLTKIPIKYIDRAVGLDRGDSESMELNSLMEMPLHNWEVLR